jgi:hypothetical protein
MPIDDDSESDGEVESEYEDFDTGAICPHGEDGGCSEACAECGHPCHIYGCPEASCDC